MSLSTFTRRQRVQQALTTSVPELAHHPQYFFTEEDLLRLVIDAEERCLSEGGEVTEVIEQYVADVTSSGTAEPGVWGRYLAALRATDERHPDKSPVRPALSCGCFPHKTRMTGMGFTCETEQQGYCNFECPHEEEAHHLTGADRVEAHNVDGITLRDCLLCQAGEPMIHNYERGPE